MTKATQAIWLLLACCTSSCLSVDNEGPILSVELFWDEIDSSGFRGGDCRSADVDSMDWVLYTFVGDEKVEIDRVEDQDCINSIDFLDPPPGDYELELRGYRSRQMIWSDECSPLTVTRFDVVYECDITAP